MEDMDMKDIDMEDMDMEDMEDMDMEDTGSIAVSLIGNMIGIRLFTKERKKQTCKARRCYLQYETITHWLTHPLTDRGRC